MAIRSHLSFLKMHGLGTASGILADLSEAVARKLGRRPIAPGVEITDFDPLDAATLADPYPYYRRLLASGPVHYSAKRGIYILSRYEDVRAGARASDVLSSADGISFSRVRAPSLLTTDPPRHTQMRKQAQPAFTRGALEGWHPMVEKLAKNHVASLLRTEPVDIVPLLAEPLPTAVIAHILGIADDDLAAFREWSNETSRMAHLNLSLTGLRQGIRGLRAVSHFHAYFTEKLSQGDLLGAETVLGRLVANTQDGKLSNDELFFFAFLLLLAGNDTTVNMLGTLFVTLADNPEQLRLLHEHPELIPGAIEEQLRYYAPIQGLYRTALSDYSVGSATIPAGARVLLLWGAANRDSDHFEEPDAFRVERNPTGHVSFGSGIHLCLGAQLARLEGIAVLRELVDHVERVEIVGEPRWRVNPTLRGLSSLRVQLTRRESPTTDPPIATGALA